MDVELETPPPTKRSHDMTKEKTAGNLCEVNPNDPNLSPGHLRSLFALAQNTLKSTINEVNVLKEELKQYSEQELLQDSNKKHKDSDEGIDRTDDIDDDSSHSTIDNSMLDKYIELKESLQKKNAYIKELIDDLQALDEENKLFKNELLYLKNKLSEATSHIEEQTILLKNSKTEASHYAEQVNYLKNTESIHQSQIANLIESNNKYEVQMDEFALQMDLRITQWEEILKSKQTETEELNKELLQLQQKLLSFDQLDPDNFVQAIQERDIQIENLKEKLSEATNSLLLSTSTIEKLKNSSRQEIDISSERTEENNTIDRLKFDLQKLKHQNEDLEDCLKIKEIELAEALAQINDYELSQDTNDVAKGNKKYKQQLKIRDEQIKKLVAENNSYINILGQFQLENSIMRKKLNLSPQHVISSENILTKYTKLKKQMNNMKKKHLDVDEQNLSLKIQLRQKEKAMRKLQDFVKSQGIKIPDHFLAVILTEENMSYQAFEVNSNDHFLQSEFQNIDENPTATSSTFELNIDDDESIDEEPGIVRREKFAVDGNQTHDHPDLQWQHPMMQILMDLKLEKNNQDNLCAMLQEARKEILYKLDLLAKESQKNSALEQNLLEMQKDMKYKNLEHEKQKSEGIEVQKNIKSSINETNNLTFDGAINDFLKLANKSYTLILHDNLMHFHKQFEMLYDNMIDIFTHNSNEKNRWILQEEQHKKEIQELTLSLESMKTKLLEMENTLSPSDSVFDNNQKDGATKIDNDQNNSTDSLPQNIINTKVSKREKEDPKYFEILSKKVYFERKSIYLEEYLKNLRNECSNVKNELYNSKIETLEAIKQYEIKFQEYMINIANLRNSLRKSIPLEIYAKQNSKFLEYEFNYRKLLNEFQNEKYISLQNKFFDSEYKDLIKKFDHISINDNNLLNDVAELKLIKGIDTYEKPEMIEGKNIVAQVDQHSEDDNENLMGNIYNLEKGNLNLQKKYGELIDKIQVILGNDEYFLHDKAKELISANEKLKIKNVEMINKIQILEEQINNFEQNELNHNLELNILRHQILDLQSVNNDKAIIARLSGEILVSHMQFVEMQNKQNKLVRAMENEKIKCQELKIVVDEKDTQFDNYVSRSNIKIRLLSATLHTLREQYQASLPLTTLENIKNMWLEMKNKLKEMNESTNNIIDMRNDLENYRPITSLKNIENKCDDQDIMNCSHAMNMEISKKKWERERNSLILNCNNMKQINNELEKRIESLEENLVILTFAFENNSVNDNKNNQDEITRFNIQRATSVVELTDVDDNSLSNIQAQQKPIPLPRTIKTTTTNDLSNSNKEDDTQCSEILPGSPAKMENKSPKPPNKIAIFVQTDSTICQSTLCQTDERIDYLNESAFKTENMNNKIASKLNEALNLASERLTLNLELQTLNSSLANKIGDLNDILKNKDTLINNLESEIKKMRMGEEKLPVIESDISNKEIEYLKSLLKKLQSVESDKDATIEEYKELLKNEKSEHNKTSTLAQKQIIDMKINMENLEKEHNSLKELMTKPSHVESYNTTMENHRKKILDLEEKCFQLQRDIDQEHATLISTKFECERWKNLAAERFTNLETLKKHLEEKHENEVTCYKSESFHWLTELKNSKDELTETKIEFNNFKTTVLQQLVEKDNIIEKLDVLNTNLKEKLLTLQTVVSASNPSLDLNSIIELNEEDAMNFDNNQSSLEEHNMKFRNTMIDPKSITYENIGNGRISSNWIESLLEKLRREKQMLNRQNIILRKQIKILSARERRARLEVQNLKSQVSKRPSVNHSKIMYDHEVDINFLMKKIESLESQVSEKTSVNSNGINYKNAQLTLWEKQKRWQQCSEKWRQQFYEKCSELDKLKRSLESCRLTIQRMDKEKRSLDSRLSKYSREGFTPSTITGDSCDNNLELLLQDKERLEKEVETLKAKLMIDIKHSSLLERLEMQQRRITALELAERGKEVLVNEYERLLAQNSLLAKQNIKLESEILENQLSSHGKRLEPDGSDGENNCCRRIKQQNEHLEKYIKLMKEENSQLIAKQIEMNALNTQLSTSTSNQRTVDLERTVLTLRALLSKLQVENKRLTHENIRLKKSIMPSQENKLVENLKLEIESMREMIKEKDMLLKKSKELLKKAMEKEKNCVNDNDGSFNSI